MVEGSWWTAWASGREKALRGKHRTEVMEVKRGIEVGWWKVFGGQLGLLGGKRRFWESIAQRSWRGIEVGWWKVFGGQLGLLGGKRRFGEASHRGH